jgi:hypothetical protein
MVWLKHSSNATGDRAASLASLLSESKQGINTPCLICILQLALRFEPLPNQFAGLLSIRGRGQRGEPARHPSTERRFVRRMRRPPSLFHPFGQVLVRVGRVVQSSEMPVVEHVAFPLFVRLLAPTDIPFRPRPRKSCPGPALIRCRSALYISGATPVKLAFSVPLDKSSGRSRERGAAFSRCGLV